MIIDEKWVLKTSGGSEDLATSGTTAVTSDYIDLGTADWQDAGRPLTLFANVTSNTAATGADFTFEIQDCDTSGGTYVAIASKTIARTALTVGTVVEILLPFKTRRFLKVKITPGSSMTGVLTCRAAFVNK